MNTPLPSEVGPYKILRPIARGGMAEVYEVEEPSSGEHLALKLLVQTGGAKPRFHREYEAMIRLNHPNIVRVYNYGTWEDHPWLSMELVEGTPIQAYAKRCGRPGTPERTREVIRVAHDLALALDHVHHRGLIHRDLKSANVLVLPDGRVKLLDFGTAKVSDPVQEITRDGEFIGTFAYASPEQLLNRGLDYRADLYSYGVLLFRLATGKRPFNAKELHLLARQHVKEAPPPPSDLCELPPGLEAVILALLEKKPENRPQSGAEVAEALEAVAGAPLYPPGTLDVDLSSERLVGREDQLSQLWSFLDGEANGQGAAPGSAPADMAMTVGLQGSGRHRVMQVMEREIHRRTWRSVPLYFLRGAEDLRQVTQAMAQLTRSFGHDAPARAQEYIRALQEVEQAQSLSVAERLEVLRSAGAGLFAERCRLDGRPVVLMVRGLQHAGPVGFEALVGLREEISERAEPETRNTTVLGATVVPSSTSMLQAKPGSTLAKTCAATLPPESTSSCLATMTALAVVSGEIVARLVMSPAARSSWRARSMRAPTGPSWAMSAGMAAGCQCPQAGSKALATLAVGKRDRRVLNG